MLTWIAGQTGEPFLKPEDRNWVIAGCPIFFLPDSIQEEADNCSSISFRRFDQEAVDMVFADIIYMLKVVLSPTLTLLARSIATLSYAPANACSAPIAPTLTSMSP